MSLTYSRETTLPAIVTSISKYDYKNKDGTRKFGVSFEFSILNFDVLPDSMGSKSVSVTWPDLSHFTTTFQSGVGVYNLTGTFAPVNGKFGMTLQFKPSKAELLFPLTEKGFNTMYEHYQKALVAQQQK